MVKFKKFKIEYPVDKILLERILLAIGFIFIIILCSYCHLHHQKSSYYFQQMHQNNAYMDYKNKRFYFDPYYYDKYKNQKWYDILD